MNRRDEDYFVKRSVSEKKEEANNTSVSNGNTRIRAGEKGSLPSDAKRRQQVSYSQPKSVSPAEIKPRELTLKEKAKKMLFFERFDKPGSIDTVFLILLVMIISVGTVMSFSASYAYSEKTYGNSYQLIFNHVGVLLFAALFLFVTAFSPPELYKGFTYCLALVSIILLILVLFVGVVHNGAQRWIKFPGLPEFQPSEIAKLALVMLLALYMSGSSKKIESENWKTSLIYGVGIPFSIFGVFAVLIYFEHHFSAIIIFFSITVLMMFIGRTWIGWLIGLGLLGATAIAGLIFFSDYATERLTMWLDPFAMADDSGWQTVQGLYAIASGGLFGVGLGNSIQKFGYVSEPQNDFIFTIVCEELGFIGAFAVIILFALLIMRGFYIAKRAPNKYSYYLVMGLMIKLALQVAFNIAVVTNTFPNTGISLPFFSSGGTQLMLQMIEMGLVLSISRFSTVNK